MKMVVAYVAPERFEGLRQTLLDLGFPSLSALSAAGTTPEATVTTTYRGAQTESHSRQKARLECIVGDEHAETVVEAVLNDGGEHTFAFVVAVESAYPLDTVKLDEAEAPVA
ncbi:MAG TPA: P-II family nitrogen regulator [Thermoleophilaceae bacterium]